MRLGNGFSLLLWGFYKKVVKVCFCGFRETVFTFIEFLTRTLVTPKSLGNNLLFVRSRIPLCCAGCFSC